MSETTQVELAVDAREACPVAAASAEQGVAESVSWSHREGGRVVEEFSVDGDLDDPDAEAEPVFETGTRTRYRFERKSDPATCPCEAIEALDVPVTDVRARDGSLYVTFYVADVSRVRDLVEDLRERFGEVRLTHIRRSGETAGGDPVRVDRGRLTERQYEVLQTAFEMGYFQRPKGANASEVAAALDISVATLVEHLARAQTKLLEPLLAGPDGE
ncbi:MAG: helix-turn-helix domain-containing protein [Halosimplex sp.]